ncbi:MAG: hypothetical protein JXB46_00085, partial [Candidatus Eisenbacteria bacterium]|nr:hypothetical protein [Candidatus Eisenbacteria bacterium]
MSRVATGLFVALLLSLSVFAFAIAVGADGSAVVLMPRSGLPLPSPHTGQLTPNCISTVEVLADGITGSELRFSFGWEPTASGGVP